MTWSSEDGGPERMQWADGGLHLGPTSRLTVTKRETLVATMCVWGGDRLYLLTHSGGEDATLAVEEIDPLTLATRRSTGELPAGPIWPGGLAALPDGSLHAVVGRWAYRFSEDLEVLARRELPRAAPYNSFVTLRDERLVTKDFGEPGPATSRRPTDRPSSSPSSPPTSTSSTGSSYPRPVWPASRPGGTSSTSSA